VSARAIGPVVGLLLAIARTLPIADPDYHWHLATGRFIAQRRSIPRVDPFSHTALGAPWKFVDWLADLFMYGLHRLGGDAAVTIAFAVAGGAAVALATERARRLVPRASPLALLAIAIAVATVVGFRVTPRPQTLTFVAAAALLLFLDRGALVAVPIVIAVWQNLHSSALLGVAIVFAYAVAARRRAMWLTFGASIGALFFAVRPLDRLAAGFDHVGDRRVAELFPEWGHPFAAGVFGAWVVVALVLLALAAPSYRKFLGPALAALGLALVALVGARFLPLFAIAAAPLALETIAGRSVILEGALAIAAAIAAALHVQRPGVGLARGAFPERAASFVATHGVQGKLFNDYHFGGYLIWTLGDRAPVFVDGRSMALYGVDFVQSAATATDTALEALVAKYDVALAIVPPDRRMGTLQRRPGWSLLYFDDVASVLVRDLDHPSAYRAVTPGTWFELAPLRSDPARLARAEVEVARARAEAPDSSIALVLAVAVALAARDFPRADALLVEADAKFRGAQRVMRARLLRHLELGDRGAACETARAIAAAYPSNSYTTATITALRCP